ncbi:MAG: MFS transporter, partial [Chloroflexi bacterium]|nr:MFS transporter [Chloroflexota bacterium]
GALQYYFAFFLLSLGFSVGGFVPSITAVNAWMVRNRATGMSFVIGGSSIAGLLVPPMVWSISNYGWRPTVFVIGIIAIVLGPLVARLLGRRPTGAIPGHLFLQLTDSYGVNLDDATSASVFTIMVVTSFVFQLGGGIMGDRISKRVLVPFLLLIQGGALVILAIADSFIMAAVFAVVWGVGFGARTPLLHAMRGEYFGRRHFGTILGLSSFPMSVGITLAPFLMGLVHDIQHTYEWGLYVLAATCVLASVTILFATRPIPPGVQQRMRARRARERRNR